MIAKLELKDAKGKTHGVELVCVEHEEPAALLDRATTSLDAWTEHGTTKSTGPYVVVKCEVV